MSNNNTSWKCSLDVITDGSDSTGAGSVMLTIYNQPKNISHIPVVAAARYAFNVPELLTRICIDQSQKGISQLRAAFLSSSSVECAAGLPGLCLRLNEYSLNETLTISGPVGLHSKCEFIAREVLNRRCYPRIETCEVAVCDDDDVDDGNKSSWWQQVYEDEFVVVYARAYDVSACSDISITYVPPLLQQCYGNFAAQFCSCQKCSSNRTDGDGVKFKSSSESDRSHKFPNSNCSQVSYICTIRGQENTKIHKGGSSNQFQNSSEFSFAIYPNGAVLSPLPGPLYSKSTKIGCSSGPLPPLQTAVCIGGGFSDTIKVNNALSRMQVSLSGFCTKCDSSWDSSKPYLLYYRILIMLVNRLLISHVTLFYIDS